MTGTQVQAVGRYRGRIAPSPTGYLHVGHARTFWVAWSRARAAGGTVILRNDDLDRDRVRPEFVAAMQEDLRWFGLDWDEGPIAQSGRFPVYREVLDRLKSGGLVYPCTCSRRDILAAVAAPHAGEDEPVYPGTCRDRDGVGLSEARVSWRFRVPEGDVVTFEDGIHGTQRFVGGRDFGDFVVWRHDGIPSYQLACAVDDGLMGITEVVRGEDLLASTARQILILRAMGWMVPRYHHCPLVRDENGVRLAKRHAALGLRELRAQGRSPESIRAGW